MTKVYFDNGKYSFKEGPGHVERTSKYNDILKLENDDFLLFGDYGKDTHPGLSITSIKATNASIDAKNTKTIDTPISFTLDNSKAENIVARQVLLFGNSSISNSSIDELASDGSSNNTVDGIVSVKTLELGRLSIAKNGILKVPNKNGLNFLLINGEGRIYDEKAHTYYDTNNKFLAYEPNIDLFTLNNGDGNETFSFDGSTLTLNENSRFNLTGDKAIDIINNANILKADIAGAQLKNITGNGTIRELSLSNNANPTINNQIEYVNPINLNLNTLKNSNGSFYNFDGTKLVLNKGYEFNLNGDKSAFIVNNGTILKANINGEKLINISGSGSIKELHLSGNAHFNLNGNFQKAVIEKGSILTLFNQIDFSKLSGEGFVNINGTFYDTDGHALNNAISLGANIITHNFTVAKAVEKVKEQKDAYINVDKQNSDVELLSQEIVNNDNLL